PRSIPGPGTTTSQRRVDVTEPDRGAADGAGVDDLDTDVQAVAPSGPAEAARRIDSLIDDGDLRSAAELVAALPPWTVVEVLERSSAKDRAVLFRLLSKDNAHAAFQSLAPPLQSERLRGPQDHRDRQADRVSQIFAELGPDDRAGLVDELPAEVATRLMRGLSKDEHALTSAVLGYPVGSVGRRMTPEFVSTHPDTTAGQTLERV